MRLRQRSFRLSAIAGCVAITLAQASIAVAQESKQAVLRGSAENLIEYDIPAQSLESALSQFALQSKRQLIFDPHSMPVLSTTVIKGAYAPEEALRELLRDSGLEFRISRGDTIVVTAESTSVAASAPARFRLAQALIPSSMDTDQHNQPLSRIPELEEIIVTGTHIRGVENRSSPVIRFDRVDIEASGYATTQQLVQSLPQNFNNVSDATFGSINGGPGDRTYEGAGLNLRGLGSDSTLVLLNGRRLASAGIGSFVDVSMIPLSAVERVDVLTDGASAIYGSDAVGGVVNFVMRKDFEGAETRLRYGTVTQGNHDELQAGQLLGHAWDSGHALVSYEYYRRSDLDGADRDFIQFNDLLQSYKAIPEQKRQSGLVMLTQRLSERIELGADLLFGQRDSVYEYSVGAPTSIATEVKQYGASVGLSVELSPSWLLRISGLFDQNQSYERDLDSASGVMLSQYEHESSLRSVDVAADGPIAEMPGGSVRVALGGQFRVEQFTEALTQTAARLDRDIAAAYAELRVPLIGTSNRRRGAQALEFTVAGRFEDYSDFGSTFNPKLGLAWSPLTGMNVRGSWGTSFRAPMLSRLNPGGQRATVYEDLFMDRGTPTTALYLSGTGLDLEPEESKNWTVGFDVVPHAVPELEISTTYFDIEYDRRIRPPFPGSYDLFGNVLADAHYAAFVTRNPGAATITSLLERSTVSCLSPGSPPRYQCDPAIDPITAIVDGRVRNVATVQTSGLDLSLRYRWRSGVGDWGFQLGGQRLLEHRERLTSGAPLTDQLNDVWRPVDLRLRSSISFARGGHNAVVFVNYTDGYRDTRDAWQAPNKRDTVASWTTFDLTLQSDVSSFFDRLGLKQTTLSVSAINLLDRDPPFIGSYLGVFFDGVNANPLGRFLSAQVVSRW